MFQNKMLWHSIGSMYVTVAFAILAKRHAETAYWSMQEAVNQDYLRELKNSRKAA
jgi:hypothetical protein